MAAQSSGDSEMYRSPLLGGVMFPKLSAYWKSGLGCDATIVCQDGSLAVPSVLLSVLSERMKEIISLSKDKVLTFVNISIHFWKDIFDLLYSGKLPLNEDCDNSSDIFTNLLVAHGLELDDILALYKHLFIVEDFYGISEFSKSSCPEETLVEYSCNGNDILFSTTLSNQNLDKLKAYFQNLPHGIQQMNVNQSLVNKIREKCVICKYECVNKIVQCVYCGDKVPRESGDQHMNERHNNCPSRLWPFRCELDENEHHYAKGHMTCKDDQNHYSVYQCDLCQYTGKDCNLFLDHFLTHGFYPQMCHLCGDVYSDLDSQNKHLDYCGTMIDIKMDIENEILESEDQDTFLKQCISVTPEVEFVVDIENEVNVKAEDDLVCTSASTHLPAKCIACFDKCDAENVMCLFCNEIVSNDVSHMEKEHKESKNAKTWAYTCNIKNAEGRKTKELLVKKHCENETEFYKCTLCFQAFIDKNMMMLHVRGTHKVTSFFHCNYCECEFRNEIFRNGHQHLCGGGDYIQCKKCNVFFRNNELLNQHMNLHLRHEKEQKSTVITNNIKTLENVKATGQHETKQKSTVKIDTYLKKFTQGDQQISTTLKDDLKSPDKVNTRRLVAIKKHCLQIEHEKRKSAKEYPSEPFSQTTCKMEAEAADNTIAVEDTVNDEKAERIEGISKHVQAETEDDANCTSFDNTTEPEIELKIDVDLEDVKVKTEECLSLDSSDTKEFERIVDSKSAESCMIWKPMCCSCGIACSATKVKCIYCNKIVNNNIDHMKKIHQYTPKSSLWAYSCNLDCKGFLGYKRWVVCHREPVKQLTDIICTKYHYKCTKCGHMFPTIAAVKCHLVDVHDITANICSICEHGFASRIYLSDHYHFCSGGKPFVNKDVLDQCSQNDTNDLSVCMPSQSGISTVEKKYSKSSEDKGLSTFNQTIKKEILQTYEEIDCNPGDVWQPMCYHCGKDCITDQVKCIYCYKIVDKVGNHMENCHPYTPKTSKWVYTCCFYKRYSYFHDWIVCTKDVVDRSMDECKEVTAKAKEQGFLYTCSVCRKRFVNLSEIKSHLKVAHKIHVRLCQVCSNGFKDNCYLKDHEHFCKGGELVSCDICKKMVGCWKTYYYHAKRYHSKSVIDNSSDSEPEICDDVFHGDNTCLINDGNNTSENTENENLIASDVTDGEETLKTNEGQIPFTSTTLKVPLEMSKDVIQPDDKLTTTAWKPMCFNCGKNCNSAKVKCIYCFKVVGKVGTHMESCHPYTPKSSMWVYTCTFVKEVGESSTDLLVCTKDHVADDEQSKAIGQDFVHTCKKCRKLFSSVSYIQSHLKEVHNITVKLCKICSSGFTNSASLKDHEHFCNGGKLSKDMLFESYVSNLVSLRDLLSQNLFKEAKFSQEKENNPKRCFTCGDDCAAEEVKCTFCWQIVPASDRNHMSEHHPFIPKNTVWAVSCNTSELCPQSPIISVKITCAEEGMPKALFQCLLCQERYKVESELSKHFELFHTIDPHFCSVCKTGFNDHEQEICHEYFCNGGDLLKCNVCGILVGSWSNAKLHFSKCSLRNKINISSFVDSKSKNKTAVSNIKMPLKESQEELIEISAKKRKLENNEASNTFVMLKRDRSNGIIKVCLICDDKCKVSSVRCIYCFTIVNDAQKDEHMKQYHPFTMSNLWPVKCKHYKKGSNFVVAVQILSNNCEINQNKTSYKCELCPLELVLPTQDMAEEHIKNEHGVESFFCVECGMGMRTRRSRDEHMHFCSGNDLVKCGNCNLLVGTWYGAYEHQRRSCIKPNKSTCEENLTNIIPTGDVNVKKKSYGYDIVCGDCKGPCNKQIVRCGLCDEKCEREDVHMKLKHPYSPCTTWIVFCKNPQRSIKVKQLEREKTVGERVPIDLCESVLEEFLIPSKLPFNYKCNLCTVVTAEKEMLLNHITFAHLQDTVLLNCKSCDAVMTDKILLENHSQYCSQGKLFTCYECNTNKIFGTKRKLTLHNYSLHPEKKHPLIKGSVHIPYGTQVHCIELNCDFKASKFSSLQSHNKKVHGYKRHQISQICRICFKVFRQQIDRELHHQREHLGGQKILCETCGQEFDTPCQRKRHDMYYHKGEREKSSLMQKYHRPKHVCPQCGVMYKSVCGLNKHIRVVHEKKLYYCKFCNKGLHSASVLKDHENSHIGLKNYHCPYCSYKAYRGSRINSHIDKIHRGCEKPYKRTYVFPPQEKVTGSGSISKQNKLEPMSSDEFVQLANPQNSSQTIFNPILWNSDLE